MRTPDVAVPRRARVPVLAVVVAVLAGLLAVAAPWAATPAAALTVIDTDAAPSGQNCLSNVLHGSTSFPGCKGLTVQRSILVNGEDVAAGTELQVGDVIDVIVRAFVTENSRSPFYTETGDGLINTEDWEERIRVALPTQSGVLSAPTLQMGLHDAGDRSSAPDVDCATQSGQEPARSDSARVVTAGAAPVGTNGMKATVSGPAVTFRFTTPSVDRCANSLSVNGLYGGQVVSVSQRVIARPTSNQTLTWGPGGIALGLTSTPGSDRLTWGPARTMSLSIKGLPTAPTGVTATAQASAAQVSWSAPSTDGGTALSGYRVQPFIGGSPQAERTFFSTARTQSITGLTNGTAYTFKVAAFTSVGTGAQSAASSAVTPVAPPGAPTGVTAAPGNASATVSWTNPTSTGGAPLTRARVSIYRNGAFAGEQNPTPTPTSLRIIGLTNGDNYTITVAVGNAVAFGAASAPSAAVVPGPQPAAPTLTTVVGADGSLAVDWTPGDDGGSPVTGSITNVYDLDGNLVVSHRQEDTQNLSRIFGLTNGTSYQVTVALSNARGFGFPSALSAPVTVGVGPAPPTITGTSAAFSPNSVFVFWDDPTDTGTNPITGGRIHAYASGVEVANQPYDGDFTNGQVEGLTAGTSYTFTVQVCNVAACSPESAASASVTAIGEPSAPSISFVNRTAAGVDLFYNRSTDGGGRPIAGYRITPYINGVAQPSTYTSNPGVASVDFLDVGTEYTFTVAADNGFYFSPESAPSDPTYAGLPSLPSAPTIGTATAGTNIVIVRWTPPTDDGHDRITRYWITPYLAGIAQPEVEVSGSETESGFQVPSGLAFRFTVTASNGAGRGPASALSNEVVATPPAGAPGAPTGVRATAGPSSATVSWTAGARAATAYAVTPYVAGRAQPTRYFPTSATTATVTGLTNGTTYKFRVEASNPSGTGKISALSNPTVPATTPAAPGTPRTVVGVESVTLTWTVPADNGGSVVTGYRVTPYIGGVAQLPLDFAGTGRTRTVDELVAGVRYTFTVAATNAVGTGAESVASPAAAPTAPAGTADPPVLGAVTPGDGALTASWTPPAVTGSGPLTGYRVFVFAAGLAAGTYDVDDTTTSLRVPDLSNGVAHTVRVATLNGSGLGRASAASAAVTPGPTPSAPTVTKVTAGNGTVAVKWTASPAVPGASAVTAYRVTPYVGGAAQDPVTFAGTLTTRTVVGLTNGTAYRFTVAAVNDSGPGADSALSASATPSAPPGTATAPTIGTAEAFNTTAVVRWTAPASDGGSAITGYRVTPFVAGIAGTPVSFANANTVQVMTGLTNGTTYVFRVAAVNVRGVGTDSAASNAVTPNPAPGTPAAPSITGVTPADGAVAVSWNPPADDGGAPVTGYRITPYIGATAQPAFQFSDTATSHTVTGLTNGTTYRFVVAAVNAHGPGVDSARSAPVTPHA